ncbi:MAG: hypothetical protein JXB10_09925, partial [Pirellulales bacterium]|nr:hypothetical protein [Pirellulales bacterium]
SPPWLPTSLQNNYHPFLIRKLLQIADLLRKFLTMGQYFKFAHLPMTQRLTERLDGVTERFIVKKSIGQGE